jgi:hypothetical protein
MTHDELLAKMDYEVKAAEFEDACGDGNDPRIARALRAVVELHKPWTMENGDGEESLGCSCIPELPAFLNPYPCATIQAIEEHLK